MNYEARIFAGKICKTTAYPRPFPSLFYFPGITSKPWHETGEFSFVKYIESRFKEIKQEFLENKQAIESEAVKSKQVDQFQKVKEGEYLQFPLINKGLLNDKFGTLMPKTMKIFQDLEKAGEGPMRAVPFSSSYLSVMKPTTALNNHYGPCNIRLRCNLPILLPEASEACFIRVGGQVKFWKEGEIIIYDDTYEHESCNLSEVHDLAKIVFDIWHPEITTLEREAMLKLFNSHG